MANAKKTTANAEVKEEEVTTAEPAVTPEAEAKTEDAGATGQGEQMVEVSKEDLRKFMDRLDSLEKDNSRLIEASDKARMAAISERERGDKRELPIVRLSRLGKGGKLIIAWQTTMNESYVSGNRAVENQEIELFYEDGTSERMPLLSFYRKQNKETRANIVGRTTDEDGKVTLKIRMQEDGKEMDMLLKFVN